LEKFQQRHDRTGDDASEKNEKVEPTFFEEKKVEVTPRKSFKLLKQSAESILDFLLHDLHSDEIQDQCDQNRRIFFTKNGPKIT
jgi:hypothetical protein